ncbi:anti sigma factor C-terminal domain-containing protein [Paenibacillus sp. GCM10027626]|uniref:anti-sigma factor n=1 Tax=Paenibacillus sp. GCM10027626 TaxID=3273411 RepID=UPI0036329618
MSEQFKKQLKAYAEGKLSDEERAAVEQEIEKMEAYQSYLDEVMGSDERRGEGSGSSESSGPSRPSGQRRVIRRGKWKARIVNVLSVLAVLLVLAIVSSVITGIFYGTGKPARIETYRDVVASAVAVSQPNVTVSSTGSGSAFFSMDLTGKLNKRVGDGQVRMGEFSMKFLMNHPVSVAWPVSNGGNGGNGGFYYPVKVPLDPGERQKRNKWGDDRLDHNEWAKLDKLPEGTVAEAFLSFNQFYTTDELLQKLQPLNMDPVWFAADTGFDPAERGGNAVTDPLGFPYYPLWHAEDFTMTHYEEQKTGWFGKVVTSGGSYPALDAYGDGKLRNENFVNTLQLLQQYKAITAKAAPFLNVDQALQYIEQNGVRLYGAVVTGPVKELLKLRDAAWVSHLQVGEVQLWNWNERE